MTPNLDRFSRPGPFEDMQSKYLGDCNYCCREVERQTDWVEDSKGRLYHSECYKDQQLADEEEAEAEEEED